MLRGIADSIELRPVNPLAFDWRGAQVRVIGGEVRLRICSAACSRVTDVSAFHNVSAVGLLSTAAFVPASNFLGPVG